MTPTVAAAGEARWRIEPLAGGLGAFASQWDELNERAMASHPLLTSVFVDLLLRRFGDGGQMLCMLEGGGPCRAMAIVQRRQAGFWSSFLPAQSQLGPVLAVDSVALNGLVAQLPGMALAMDLLCMDPLCVGVPPSTGDVRTAPHAVTMNVELRGAFDTYWDSRANQLKKNMRRYERRAIDDGFAPRFVVLSSPGDMRAAVERYAAVESRGWKGAAGTALAPGNDQCHFYGDLLERNSRRGLAHVFELWFGDRLVASRLVVASHRMLVILKTTYDEAFSKLAPGRQLLKHVLEYAFAAHQGKVLEFYTDATQDQLAWSTDLRRISHWTFYRNSMIARLVSAGRVARLLARRPSVIAKNRALTTEVCDGVQRLPADALRLLESAEARSIQLGADWYRAITRSVFTGDDVRFAIVRENDSCIAVIPCLLRKGAWRRELASLSNYYTGLYAPAVRPGIKAQSLALGLEALAESAVGVSRLTISPMDPESDEFELLTAACDLLGWIPFRFFCFGNWYHRPQGRWDAYQRQLDGRLRNTIARMKRRFLAKGGRLEIVKDAAGMEDALRGYLHVYARSWKNAEPFPDFLPTLVQTFAPRGTVRIGVAQLDSHPIAAQLWFVSGGRAEIYKLAHDESYKQYSPGTLLTALMMQEAMDVDRVCEIDYLIGDDPYKKDWMDQRRERWGVVAYNPRSAAGVVGLCRESIGRMLRSWLGPGPGAGSTRR